MPRRAVVVPADVREVLLEIWAANDRMNQLILEHLDPRAWRARLPGRTGRTIAAISWPAGPTMVAYMLAHEAHHRGQVLMLAHQLGYRAHKAMYGIWQWEKLWKQCGFTSGPR